MATIPRHLIRSSRRLLSHLAPKFNCHLTPQLMAPYVSHISLISNRRFSQNQLMLQRKDGTVMTVNELQLLFEQISKVLVQIEKDPDNPPQQSKMDNLIGAIRNLRLEYAPGQLRLVAAHFMVCYHEFRATAIYKSLISKKTKDGKQLSKDFHKFKKKLASWHEYVKEDMEYAYSLVKEMKESDAAKWQRELAEDDDASGTQSEELGEKLLRTIKLNIAMRTDNNERLRQCFNDVMIFKNINLLDEDECILAFGPTAFLGDYKNLIKLGDRAEKEIDKEVKKATGKKATRTTKKTVLHGLPSGLDFFEVYQLVKEEKLHLMDCIDAVQSVGDFDWGWFKLEHFFSEITEVDCGKLWTSVRDQYLEEATKQSMTQSTLEHSVIRKMGAACQIFTIFGSDDHCYKHVPSHMHGVWLEKGNGGMGENKQRIIVKGRSNIPMVDEDEKKVVLVHKQEWTLDWMGEYQSNGHYWKGNWAVQQWITDTKGRYLHMIDTPPHVKINGTCQLAMIDDP